jgi:hypothetical protein
LPDKFSCLHIQRAGVPAAKVDTPGTIGCAETLRILVLKAQAGAFIEGVHAKALAKQSDDPRRIYGYGYGKIIKA